MCKVLTISVAAYNVEWCLDETLKSMVVEKVMPYIEVIIVNDGSKDKTLEIANKYHELYPETFIVIDKENGGHGSTINASIEKSTGKYFKIVDGDDWVNQEDFSAFISLLEQCDADVVTTKFVECYTKTGTEILVERNICGDEKKYPIDDFLLRRRFCMHETAVKTELLKACNITVEENCFYVDTEYMLYALTNAKTIVESDLCIYRYRLGEIGQSVSPESRAKRIQDQRTVLNNMLRYNEINFQSFSKEKKKFVYKELNVLIRYILESYCYRVTQRTGDVKNEILELIRYAKHDFKNFVVDEFEVAMNQSSEKKLRGRVLDYYLYQALKHNGLGLSLYIYYIRTRMGRQN